MFVFIGSLIGAILNFIWLTISIILIPFKLVLGLIGFLFGLVGGVFKLILAPFLAIWFFIFPAPVAAQNPPSVTTKPPAQQKVVEQHHQSILDIVQSPVDLDINQWYYDNVANKMYVKVTVKNNKIPSLSVKSGMFYLTTENNATIKSDLFNIKPGALSSKKVGEDGKTTGWLVFDTGEPSRHNTLEFRYGFLDRATVKF